MEIAAYPLYGERRTEDGELLREVIQAPTDIVISRNLADVLDAQVGDTLLLGGANAEFTLRGIVPTSEEAGFENFAGFLLFDGDAFDQLTIDIERIARNNRALWQREFKFAFEHPRIRVEESHGHGSFGQMSENSDSGIETGQADRLVGRPFQIHDRNLGLQCGDRQQQKSE